MKLACRHGLDYFAFCTCSLYSSLLSLPCFPAPRRATHPQNGLHLLLGERVARLSPIHSLYEVANGNGLQARSHGVLAESRLEERHPERHGSTQGNTVLFFENNSQVQATCTKCAALGLGIVVKAGTINSGQTRSHEPSLGTSSWVQFLLCSLPCSMERIDQAMKPNTKPEDI